MERPIIFPWALTSLLLHALIFLGVRELIKVKQREEQKSLSVAWVKEIVDRPRKQVVEIPLTESQEKPKHARFLAEKNQVAEVETRAQHPSQGKSGPKVETETETETKAVQALPNPGVAVARAPSPPAATQSLFDGERSDYLPEDIRRGDKNFINAEAFEHTGYYLEVKRKIEIAWNPRSAFSQARGGGGLFSKNLIKTVLGVTFDRSGSLDQLVVLQSSGIGAIDEEAIRSFRVSSPFTSVPDGLLFTDGKLRFEFGFIIYTR